MNKALQFSALVTIACFSAGGIGTAYAESISSALASAYRHSPELNAQRAATRAQDEAVAQAKSGFRPRVTADADFGFSTSRGRSAGQPFSSTTNPYGYGITFSQSLFDGFRTVNSVAGAKAQVEGSRQQLKRIEQTVLQTAATAYVNVLVAEETVQIRQNNLNFLREQLRSSQARLDVGEGTRTDVAQSRAELEAARAQVSAAKATLEANRASYFQFIGRSPRNLRWPTGPDFLHPSSMEKAMQMAVTQHPAVKLALASVDASLFAVKTAEGRLLPTVGAQVRAQQRFENSGRDSRSRSATATLNLNVPLYQGGEVASVIRQNKELVSQARIEVDQARDELRQLAIQSWTALAAARANVIATRAQLNAARLALSGVVEERNVGQRTQLDVLNQQSQVLTAQLNVLSSRQQKVNASYALAAAIGRLNSQALRLHVRHYNPEQHYNAVKDLWFGLRTPTGR